MMPGPNQSVGLPNAVNRFLGDYLERGFGALPKREVDRLVFRLLVESSRIESVDDHFAVSRQLRITPARAANLAYEYKLLSMPRMAVEDLRRAFGSLLDKTNIGRVQHRVALEVRDRLLREEIEQTILTLNLIAADYSFNRSLLLLDYATFAELVAHFAGSEAVKRLDTDLKKYKELPHGMSGGKELLALFLEKAAAKAGEKTGEKIIDFAEFVLTGGTSELMSVIRRLWTTSS